MSNYNNTMFGPSNDSSLNYPVRFLLSFYTSMITSGIDWWVWSMSGWWNQYLRRIEWGSTSGCLFDLLHHWSGPNQVSYVVISMGIWLTLKIEMKVTVSIWYHINWASAWDIQQFGISTCVDSDEPLQPPFKLRNSKLCSVSSLTIIGYSSD